MTYDIDLAWIKENLEAADALITRLMKDRDEKAALAAASAAGYAAVESALAEVLDAVRDYLPPDGIVARDCLTRVIAAVDNPQINAVLSTMRHKQIATDRASETNGAAAPEQPASVAGWQDISTAPYNQEVVVRVAGMTFHAKLCPDASMEDEGTTCDQWQATREGEYPPCWSDGECWISNEDGVMSLQPSAWRPAPDASATGTLA